MIRKIFHVVMSVILLGSVLMLSGCGGSSSTGMGNTVYLEASGKDGSTFSIYTDLVDTTTTTYFTGSLDYTIKSTVYSGMTGVTPSSVRITEADISYTPLLASDNSTMSPAIPSWIKYPAALVTAGGSTDITMIVVDTPQMRYLDQHTSAVATPNLQYRYIVNVVFKGVEDNTGTSITCPVVAANFYVTKNATIP